MKSLTSYLSAAFALFLIATVSTPLIAGEKQRVVYHVADAEKVQFALGNIRNHIQGVGGAQNVEIVLVVHGPAGKMFQDIEATDQVRNLVKSLQGDGVQFNMCGNTMRAQGVELEDLLPGFVRVDQGGVVRIAELQQQGYIYIRP